MKYVLLLLLVFCATGVHADETQKHDLNLQTTSVPYFPPERPAEILGEPYMWFSDLKCYVYTGALPRDKWCATKDSEGNIVFARVPPSTTGTAIDYVLITIFWIFAIGVALVAVSVVLIAVIGFCGGDI